MLTGSEVKIVSTEDFDQVMPAKDRDRFWALVRVTLDEVFHRDGYEAYKYRDRVQHAAGEYDGTSGEYEDGDSGSGSEMIAVYHASPLSIAADLADWKKPISEDMLHTFLRLQREILAKDGIELRLPPKEDELSSDLH